MTGARHNQAIKPCRVDLGAQQHNTLCERIYGEITRADIANFYSMSGVSRRPAVTHARV